MTFLDELDTTLEPTAAQDEFDFGEPAQPKTWKDDWGQAPPNVQPAFHAKVLAHFQAKGPDVSPADAYREVLKKQGGKLTGKQVISIGAQLDPFADTAPKAQTKQKADINPPKRNGKATAAVTTAAAPEPAAPTAPTALTADQLMIRNTIVATRCVAMMKDEDIDELIKFATQVASKL